MSGGTGWPFADRRLTATIGSAAHRAIARRAVRESLVLLKNEGHVLPLRKAARIHVTEPEGNGWLIELFGTNEPVEIPTPQLPPPAHHG